MDVGLWKRVGALVKLVELVTSCTRVLVNLLSQRLHGLELDVLSLFPDPVGFVRDQDPQKQLHQDQQVLGGCR